MKICSKCKELKPVTEFNKAKRYKDGLRYDCKDCQKEYRKKFYDKNRELELENNQAWKEENRQHCRDYANNYKRKHRARYSQKENERHALKLSTNLLKGDEWNDFYMDEIFELSRTRKEETGISWEIDHTIPLKGKLVTGLHVWYNLRCIPASANRSKGNRI